ncbi:MAG: Anaerobic sulfatase maturase [Candidatus Hydrogenedentes bacterium]|nr:Anaerobic sulfatase maturase [Candidatus Hydrogenedentota bacterium]
MSVRPFQLLIKPVSADCNMRCRYCFYLRAHEVYPDQVRHRMSDDVLERMISQLLRLRFPETVFAWQGGEPTVAGLDFFRRAVAFEQKHGAPGQSVGNGLQTNGVLIDEEWCQFLGEYKFLVGLSMDGPQAVHDAMRVNAAGQGNWDKVMGAARLMDQYQVPYNILCVVNSENIGLGAGLTQWFVENGFNYLQFIPCLEPGMPYNVEPERYGDFLCQTFDYWVKEGFGAVSIRDFDALLTARLGQPNPLCTYGRVCSHYIVVEHNGDVYPCDFFVYDEWKLGNIMDAPIESFMQTPKYKEFAYRKDKVPRCRGCEWRDDCHGGCQKDRLATGTVTDPSPLCAAYKKFFAHAGPALDKLAKHVQRMQRREPVDRR